MVGKSSMFFVILLAFAGLLQAPLTSSQSVHHVQYDYPRRSVASFSPIEALPPVAKKVKHEMVMFGDVRNDDYYWLRDDNRTNPEVLSYLMAENNYTNLIMSDTKKYEDKIFAELRGRIKEDDISVPFQRGKYYYYQKYLNGTEYYQYCRRYNPNSKNPPSVHDIMPTGPGAPKEHVILDVNMKAQGHNYYSVRTIKVSPDDKLAAYAEDTKGNEIFTVHVIDAENGISVEKPLFEITSDLAWVGSDTLVYISSDEILRPYKVWLHKIGSDQSSDRLLYHEEDDTFSLSLDMSESQQYLFVASESKKTRFVFYLDVSSLDKGLAKLTPHVNGTQTSASHRGNYFFIKTTSDQLYNSEISVTPVDNLLVTEVVLPHSESVGIESIQLFIDNIVVYARQNGLKTVTIYDLPVIGETIGYLKNGRSLNFSDPVYSVSSMESQFSSTILRISYSSFITPSSVYDYDMKANISVPKKIDTVVGGYNISNYVTERLWAAASDGTLVPISILYKKDLVNLDGSNPMILYGYGSYGATTDPVFSSSRLSLIDRGFIYAIAHVRGGGELGKKWYNHGKLLEKKNTFTDFISSIEYLIDNKYTSKEKLCIYGISAGGLLIGVVLNMRPDLFKAAIAAVPFVDVLTTMLDPSLPLTTEEYEEWGDPRQEEFYFYIKSYAPVDNVKPQNYPHMLVTAGLNDPRVIYSEPTKFVAKLRNLKTDGNLLLFKCQLEAGHFSKSGRLDSLKETAFTYTFVLRALGMVPPSSY